MFRQAARSFSRVVRSSFRPMKGATAAFGAAAFRSFSRASSSQVTKKVVGVSTAVLGTIVGGTTVVLASGVDYDAVRKDISTLLEDDEDMAPTLIRLAWHASGTYSKHDGSGGSDGATMRFQPECAHAANAGLDKARNFLESVKAKHPNISYADLWTLAGVVAVEYMGGPSIKWRPGRSDAPSGDHCTPDGRLPDADKGTRGSTIQHVRDIFYRMGFTDREIVALVGAHAVGRCHPDASGYDGPWTFSPTTFSNEFYRLLIEERWSLRKWDGPEQYQDQSGKLMMLPADMAFIWDPEFRKYVILFAKDEEIFFNDFARAFGKLLELGCEFPPAYYSHTFDRK